MMFDPSPPDDLITRVEQLDEALRHDGTGAVASGDVPPSIFAALKLLRGAFAPSRSPEVPLPAAIAPEAGAPKAIGRFLVDRLVGAGSFGVVYLAFDTVLRRDVALKLPRLVTTLTDPLLRRFIRESEAAARLHHPHIVQVYEAGLVESTTYISSEYCAGVTLESWLASRPEPLQARLAATLLLDLADAIEHAHESRILHRDLKPANILLCWELGQDETVGDVPEQALEQAKITDFGLARFLDEETWTASGGLVGTIAYMAPEQAEGQSAALGPPCDVYSLGVILYELLTRVRPHQGNTNADTLRRVCEEEPLPPRRRQPQIPRDLESICLKCLRKQPARRYQTARELKEDLQRYLRGEATIARPLSFTEKVVRAARRHPGWVGLGTALLVTMMLGILATAWHFRVLNAAIVQANKNWDTAEQHRQGAEAQERELEKRLYLSDIQHALNRWNQGDSEGLQRHLEKYRQRESLRGIEWDLLDAMTPACLADVPAHQGPIYASALSPDGRTLATVGEEPVVRLWDTATRTCRRELRGHTDEINALCFHPDGMSLATAGDDRTVRIWNLESGETRQVLPHGHSIYGVAWSPDGSRLATGGKENLVRVWDEAGELLFQLEPFEECIEQLKFAPDGTLGVAAWFVELWNLESRQRVARLTPPETRITTLEFSPDGKLLAGGSDRKNVMLWDVAGHSLLANWLGHRDSVHDVKFNPEGDMLFSCGRDGTVRRWSLSAVWDGTAPEESEALPQQLAAAVPLDAHEQRTWSMTFVPEQNLLVTTGEEGAMRYWSRSDLRKPRFAALDQPVSLARFSQDMRQIISTSPDGVSLWDARTGASIRSLDGGTQPINGNWGVSADGTRVAMSLRDASIRVQSLTGEGEPLLLQGHHESPGHLLFPPSRPDLLISASGDGTIRCWDLRLGVEHQQASLGETEPVRAVLSPDGSLVAYANGSYTVVRSIPEWNEISRWPCTDNRRPQAMAFSSDNRLLAVGREDHAIEIRPLANPGDLSEWTGTANAVTSVVFSPDGRTLFSGTAEGTIQVWHVATGQELGVLFREDGVRVASLCFSPDGRKLLAAIQSGDRKPRSGLLLWEAR